MELKLGKIELDGTENILSIEVPEEMKTNVSTGHSHMDILFAGDGCTPSTAALVTGTPGAGKTTLMLQVADSVTGQGHLALFNTQEESLYQVRKVVERLGLQNGFIAGQDRCVGKVLEHLTELQKSAAGQLTPDGIPQKVFLFQDSLQCLDLPRAPGKKGRPLSGDKASLVALERLIAWAKETYSFAFVIGQVNKSGEFSGKNAIKHMVDCHLHLGYEIDPDDKDNAIPIVEMTKNRFGPGGLYYHFDLKENGLNFWKTE